MNQEQVLSLVRTLLKVGGAFLVAKGTITEPGLETAVGAIITLVGIVWSAVAHKADANKVG